MWIYEKSVLPTRPVPLTGNDRDVPGFNKTY